MDPLDSVIDHIFETGYEDLSADLVDATKKQLLDILASTIGGSTCSVTDELNGLVNMVTWRKNRTRQIILRRSSASAGVWRALLYTAKLHKREEDKKWHKD